MANAVENKTGFASLYTIDGELVCAVNSLTPGWQLQSPEGTPFAAARITREEAEQDALAFLDLMQNGEDDVPPTPDIEDDPNFQQTPPPEAPESGGTDDDNGDDQSL